MPDASAVSVSVRYTLIFFVASVFSVKEDNSKQRSAGGTAIAQDKYHGCSTIDSIALFNDEERHTRLSVAVANALINKQVMFETCVKRPGLPLICDVERGLMRQYKRQRHQPDDGRKTRMTGVLRF